MHGSKNSAEPTEINLAGSFVQIWKDFSTLATTIKLIFIFISVGPTVLPDP